MIGRIEKQEEGEMRECIHQSDKCLGNIISILISSSKLCSAYCSFFANKELYLHQNTKNKSKATESGAPAMVGYIIDSIVDEEVVRKRVCSS